MDTPRRLAVWKPWGNGEAMKRNERRVPYSSAKALACAFSTFAVLALALTGCAPKANDAVVTGEDEAAAMQVDFTWSETGDCSMCHAKEQASFEDGSCAISRHKDVACSQCHADVAALSAAHEGATAEKAAKAVLKTTAVDVATCESCHSQDEVEVVTAGVTVLTDMNGTIVNPHALPESADHAEVSCVSCHQMHAAGSIEKKAQRACASCHHADVYECYTCHS